jgi:hypothetical protein
VADATEPEDETAALPTTARLALGLHGDTMEGLATDLRCCSGRSAMDYKFDGTTLRRSGSKVAVFDGKAIRDAGGSRLGSIEGDCLRGPNGNRLATFDGRDLRDANGTRIASIDEIKKKIDGPGGMSLAGLWFLLVR